MDRTKATFEENIMRKNWITMGMLSALFVFVLVSCGFEIPKSVTVRGTPGFYVPLGSPFAGQEATDSVGEYLSIEGIQKMLGPDDVMTVFDYNAGQDDDPQTYLIKYHIADMNLNLSESIGEIATTQSAVSVTVPDLTQPPYSMLGTIDATNPLYLTTGMPPVTQTETPVVTITFDENTTKWITSISSEVGTLGLKFKGDVVGDIQVAIPQWGIGTADTSGKITDWSQGDYKNSENETKFFNTSSKTWNPNTQIKVYVAIISTDISGETIAPELAFDWSSALIDVKTAQEDGSPLFEGLKGEYPLDLSSLKDTLGTLSFKEVFAYVYINNLPNAGNTGEHKLKLTYTSTTGSETVITTGAGGYAEIENAVVTNEDLESTVDPWNPDDENASLDDPLNFTSLFSAGKATLGYELTMESVEITKAKMDDTKKNITVDILIKLPLEFEVNEPASNQFDKFKTYTDKDGKKPYEHGFVKLDLAALGDMGNTGGGDLLGRTGDGDDMFGDIEYLKIWVLASGFKNDIIDGLVLGVYNTPKEGPVATDILDLAELKSSNTDQDIELTPDYPFSPTFEILIPKPSANKPGTIKVPHQDAGTKPELDFKIAVEAKTALDYKIDL
jgi:hypothetical protein